jgi:ketosteroid isomerase-like protein
MQRASLPKPRVETPHREAQTPNMSTKQIVQDRTMTMTRFSRALTLALLFSSMSLATATAAPTGAQGGMRLGARRSTANDLNAIMTLYSKDAVMWLPDAPEAKGGEAIRKSYADLLAANTVTAASFANTHYQISGDLSVGWGDFTLVLAPKAGGNPVSLSGRFSVIARNEDGKWVYVVDHASAHPAPPTPH